jgi:hypothetical protein
VLSFSGGDKANAFYSGRSDEGRCQGVRFRNALYFPEVEGRIVWDACSSGCRTCGARYGLISKGYSARDLFYVGIKSSNVFKQPGVDPNGYSGHSFRKPSCPVESLLSLPVAMTRLCGQLG